MHHRKPVMYNTETEALEQYRANSRRQFEEIPINGSSTIIADESYDSNADAMAVLGAGKLYKSTTLINGSPIILITV